jgi:hypothetical protein
MLPKLIQGSTILELKLDALAKLLDLNPYDDNCQFQQKLKPISHQSIQPIHIICPDSYECETLTCKPRSLLQITNYRIFHQ